MLVVRLVVTQTSCKSFEIPILRSLMRIIIFALVTILAACQTPSFNSYNSNPQPNYASQPKRPRYNNPNLSPEANRMCQEILNELENIPEERRAIININILGDMSGQPRVKDETDVKEARLRAMFFEYCR